MKDIEKFHSSTYQNSGIIFDPDLKSPNFTAMGSMIWTLPSVASTLQIWNFELEKYESYGSLNLNALKTFTPDINGFSWVNAKRFLNTKSRKGFMQFRFQWKSTEFEAVNTTTKN